MRLNVEEILAERPSQEDNQLLKKRVMDILEWIGKDYIGDISRTYPEFHEEPKLKRLLWDCKRLARGNTKITEILEAYAKDRKQFIEGQREKATHHNNS